MTTSLALVFAMILDALLGEPKWLWSRVPHPAVLMGRLIEAADRSLNHGTARLLKGGLLVAGLVVAMWALGWVLSFIPYVDIVLGAILLAQRSLVDHVRDVAKGLRDSLADGRVAVARIVGRDTADMDAPAISRAAIESGAENFSDGVIAPVFWFLVAGLPGLLIYKAVNTADSMIGYRTEQYEDFGKAAARLDDVLNWIPARLSALLIATASGRIDVQGIPRDAKLHRSPNAGWPEAAMSRALGVSLSGPRSYEGEMTDFPWVHADGRKTAGAADIDRACRMLWRAWGLTLAVVILFAFT
ncbi:adenosylcobinamide-phosphate synthase CbiB [Celeribacter sp.]|uniref:adenosylcobinamide-phosphate synthase CbiB n=1 Tax=Celeribacter sp. TaxID=1890673 RepID=UPI003A954F05